MTTFTFEEDIKIDNKKSSISVYDFLDILVDTGYLPKLEKLDKSEITEEIQQAYLKSKRSRNRINI